MLIDQLGSEEARRIAIARALWALGAILGARMHPAALRTAHGRDIQVSSGCSAARIRIVGTPPAAYSITSKW